MNTTDRQSNRTTQPGTIGSTGSPSDSAPSERPVDVRALLARCMGNAALVCKILDRFASQALADLQQLQTSLAESDCGSFARLAHALKGCAANLSAEGVRSAAARLEEMGRQCQLGKAQDELRRLGTQLEECLGYIPQAKKLAMGSRTQT